MDAKHETQTYGEEQDRRLRSSAESRLDRALAYDDVVSYQDDQVACASYPFSWHWRSEFGTTQFSIYSIDQAHENIEN